MSLKITFINPNSVEEVDKYLPKILAEAVLNKIAKETDYPVAPTEQGCDIKHSA
ncbi:MAG: hypothetical protein PHQ46_02215 [Negativicutes bacterium]|nr:hypothetical protein [Negativicutes bacterium]